MKQEELARMRQHYNYLCSRRSIFTDAEHDAMALLSYVQQLQDALGPPLPTPVKPAPWYKRLWDGGHQ